MILVKISQSTQKTTKSASISAPNPQSKANNNKNNNCDSEPLFLTLKRRRESKTSLSLLLSAATFLEKQETRKLRGLQGKRRNLSRSLSSPWREFSGCRVLNVERERKRAGPFNWGEVILGKRVSVSFPFQSLLTNKERMASGLRLQERGKKVKKKMEIRV